ncbi:MAG: hypothetical protein Q4D51_05460 [Eubacteriales bacterium]|nr:hypothetical protein [Eubacteriales bacterium]
MNSFVKALYDEMANLNEDERKRADKAVLSGLLSGSVIIGAFFIYIVFCILSSDDFVFYVPYFMKDTQSALGILEGCYRVGQFKILLVIFGNVIYLGTALIVICAYRKKLKDNENEFFEKYEYKVIQFRQALEAALTSSENDDNIMDFPKLEDYIPEVEIRVTERLRNGKSIIILIFIICFFIVAFFDNWIYTDGKNQDNLTKLKYEMECIQTNHLQTEEVYLSPSDKPMEKFYDYANVERFMKAYKIEGYGKLRGEVLVPNYLNFEIDKEHLYKHAVFTEDNEADAALYRVTVTPYSNLVIAIETLPPKLLEGLTFEFPESFPVKGYNRYKVDINHNGWTQNVTHAEFENGTVLDFSWEGPRALGKQCGHQSNILSFNNPYSEAEWNLRAVVSQPYYDGMIEDMKCLKKDDFINLPKNVLPYNDGYFDITETENTFRVIMEGQTSKYHGYTLILVDRETKQEGVFFYYDDDEEDQDREREIIDSIQLVKEEKEKNN